MTSPVFWVLASLLTMLALAFLLTPLWRQRQAQGRWPAQALIASVAIVPLTIALYFTVTTWDPDVALDVRAGPGEIVTQLAQRLEQNPDDVTGWRMLGRSYHALGQYAQAREAFRQAFIRTDEPDNDLKLYYGESMVLTDRDTLAGEAGRLFEEVLAVEPNNPTALWWGGVVALEAGRADLARERWTRLLAFNPPGDVAEQLQALLAMVPDRHRRRASLIPLRVTAPRAQPHQVQVSGLRSRLSEDVPLAISPPMVLCSSSRERPASERRWQRFACRSANCRVSSCFLTVTRCCRVDRWRILRNCSWWHGCRRAVMRPSGQGTGTHRPCTAPGMTRPLRS
jgi:cytochrome c-type biogenesis protein CcmH